MTLTIYFDYFNPATFYCSVCRKQGTIVYLCVTSCNCVLAVSIVLLSTILIFDFVPSVVFFSFFLFYFKIEILPPLFIIDIIHSSIIPEKGEYTKGVIRKTYLKKIRN